MIGVNNFGLGEDTPVEVARGVEEIIDQLQSDFDKARIVFLGILPVGQETGTEIRQKVSETNLLLKSFGGRDRVVFHDIGAAFPRGRRFHVA